VRRKAAERFHGRRGGRFADDGAGRRLDEIRRIRLNEARRGNWPEHSLVVWRRRASTGDAYAAAVVEADEQARAEMVGRYALKAVKGA
jgi:hypothetical protein